MQTYTRKATDPSLLLAVATISTAERVACDILEP